MLRGAVAQPLSEVFTTHPLTHLCRSIAATGTQAAQMEGTPAKRSNAAGKDTAAKKSTPRKSAIANTPTPELRQKAQKIAEQLQQLYPSPPIPLDHSTSFQLLVAVILSAQTTDKKVNEVTPQLFSVAPDAPAMASMEVGEIQRIIQPIGLAPTKAKALSNMSKLLIERHAGEVPSSFEELEALPGVGHKTASVVMSQAFGHPAFPVDTHIHRLAARWGLSSGKSVEQTEADLKALLAQESWRDVHLQIIYFGREHCPAKQHDADRCPICSWASNGSNSCAATGVNAGASTSAAGSKKPGVKRKAAAAAAAAAAQVAAAAVAAAVATEEAVVDAAAESQGRSRRRITRSKQ